MHTPTAHSNITPAQLRRQALVYIRQSTPHQVQSHQESTARQYALVQRAQHLGWAPAATVRVEEDQGRAGQGAQHRSGFQQLLADIRSGHVGLVLAREASRVARSSVDWHRLLEICALTRTRLADDGAIYDPRDPNDRLLLGGKGTIAASELFTLRWRRHEGRWNKARRGALVRSLPVGDVYDEAGAIRKDPDRQAQSRITYIFEVCERLQGARQVCVHVRDEALKLPANVWSGPHQGRIVWQAPTLSALVRL
jgi:DNA invertase Pin-like site-specific DNA recombinase